jgi:Holliday junction resolvase RusA-like endonuclease
MECKLDIHGFSVNSMYEYDKDNKKQMSRAYRKWRTKALEKMQVLPTLKELNIDPDKPMKIDIIFHAARGFDEDNLIKSFLDTLVMYYNMKDDNNFVDIHVRRSDKYARNIEDGAILFNIENCEGKIMNVFDKLLMAIDKGWIEI